MIIIIVSNTLYRYLILDLFNNQLKFNETINNYSSRITRFVYIWEVYACVTHHLVLDYYYDEYN